MKEKEKVEEVIGFVTDLLAGLFASAIIAAATKDEQAERPVSPMPETALTPVRTFPSKSNPGHYHTVLRKQDGTLICSCPGFTFRERCRHVDTILREGIWSTGKAAAAISQARTMAKTRIPDPPAHFTRDMRWAREVFGDAEQKGKPVAWLTDVESLQTNKVYHIFGLFDNDGAMTKVVCTCDGFYYRQECRHQSNFLRRYGRTSDGKIFLTTKDIPGLIQA